MQDHVTTNDEIIEWVDDFIRYRPSKIRQKGKAVYRFSKSNEFDIDEDGLSFKTSIASESGNGSYEVDLTIEPDSTFIHSNCSCPYYTSKDSDCKHIAAAAMLWKEQLQSIGKKLASKAAAHEETKAMPLTVPAIKHAAPAISNGPFEYRIDRLNNWELYQYTNKRALSSSIWWEPPFMVTFERKLEAQFNPGKVNTIIEYSGHGKLLFRCSCGKLTQHMLCEHAVEMIRGISRSYGEYYFRSFDDYTGTIKIVLAEYGLTPDDEIAKLFKFGIDERGYFVLAEKPPHLLKLSTTDGWAAIEKQLDLVKQPAKLNDLLPKMPPGYSHSGILLNLSNKNKLPFWIDGLVYSKNKSGKTTIRKKSLKEDDDLFIFSELPPDIQELIKSITETTLLTLLYQSTFGNIYSQHNTGKNLAAEQSGRVYSHIHKVLTRLRPFFTTYEHLYLLPENQRFHQSGIQKVNVSSITPHLKFRLHATGNLFELHVLILLEDEEFTFTDFSLLPLGLLLKGNIIFMLSADDTNVIFSLPGGKLAVHKKEKQNFYSRIIKPLSEKYEVDLNDLIRFEIIDTEPVGKVYLSELNNDFLLIKPRWQYNHLELEVSAETEYTADLDNTTYKVIRKKEEEEKLRTAIRELHPLFNTQRNEFFYLPFAEALKGNWFLNFYQKMQEQQIPVFGMSELKKFKYNTNKPRFEMRSSSGTDWFDLTIEVSYGDQVVSLNELKKAIINKQEFILLDDGSLGMLPKEWISQYAMLLKLGHVKEGTLQLSKFHWTVIDELHEQVDNEELVQELLEKRNRLKNIAAYQANSLPSTINATLRDYQVSGFQWLCLLDHLGWGACLADDMGLGKTLQTLSFLLHTKEKYPGETHLIVCPTSLIYNWETEINKFAPTLSYHIHYGIDRAFDEKQYSQYDLIITSYGMVRSDIEHFSKFKFGYAVLDESQSIKNPAALITRAVQLLKARNRMLLSGTPVQNNTFDLFAQMNFLNPGMLGTMEFFKNEFANDIDKYGDKEKSTQLRKLIYPFLLRRTKEQVAKDLPDKTETILWCEMESAQRKIYNSFKDYYRESILNHIKEEGLNKSGIYILEGLLKLRQICDSPALLNEEEKYPNISVKLDELIREVEENTGRHKALIFSQFTGMLHLIESELKSRKISYCYLDGSTTAKQRKEVVATFQEKDDARIFLISLKAGGVGLNLTAADYVYLIDPWWNPAVEQQAIDRTHRIGQTNKIFAYKMICKDTVEEKILSLQQKKKTLASDLIADETGFVKKLTKDDVEFLFS